MSNTEKGREHPFRSSHPNWEDRADRRETMGQNAGDITKHVPVTKSFLSYARSLRLNVSIYKMGTCFLSTLKQKTGKCHNAARHFFMIHTLDAREIQR